ncbi:2-oxoglutarate and iron-dependent oxygenase domain-containing protein [Vibrio hannami]|uniref:isopenicillin N synthase family dioxygenase n=1 Tax=Vibrio hannami TaxID=2717094 RepID=UPI00240EE7D6|nr:2-oxoglutarate and iron-dependent oxygenase domain-containing protein [Vibrio hannami]MDG3086242.1 2-oxoglutarate and iron-dependent oxygenase domain-containing protein [Vibrio hannami]
MAYALDELNFESTIGKVGQIDNSRTIPVIDLSDAESRREEITEALWKAATEVGFFQLKNHSIPLETIDKAFEQSEQFFALSESDKQSVSLLEGQNAGWEYKGQVRPSTGTPDQKESYQVTLPKMEALWPDRTLLKDFKTDILNMEYKAWQLGMFILSCFSEKLGMEKDFFTSAHNRESKHYQSTLRLLHYLPLDEGYLPQEGIWRAGAHTDFDCLTMVFQRDGEGGLQACPGKDAQGVQQWTDVAPERGIITCNIGDMLMRWSDDQLKSTLHRVKMPEQPGNHKARYSMAFFCQANKDQVIEGARGKYAPMTAEEYLRHRIEANFSE